MSQDDKSTTSKQEKAELGHRDWTREDREENSGRDGMGRAPRDMGTEGTPSHIQSYLNQRLKKKKSL